MRINFHIFMPYALNISSSSLEASVQIVESHVIGSADLKNDTGNRRFPVTEALFAYTCTCVISLETPYWVFPYRSARQACRYSIPM